VKREINCLISALIKLYLSRVSCDCNMQKYEKQWRILCNKSESSVEVSTVRQKLRKRSNFHQILQSFSISRLDLLSLLNSSMNCERLKLIRRETLALCHTDKSFQISFVLIILSHSTRASISLRLWPTTRRRKLRFVNRLNQLLCEFYD
jgi:hypothetical protein